MKCNHRDTTIKPEGLECVKCRKVLIRYKSALRWIALSKQRRRYLNASATLSPASLRPGQRQCDRRGSHESE
jgi:hypothetical protein